MGFMLLKKNILIFLYLLMLSNSTLFAQHFFYNKETKTLHTQAYIDSIHKNQNSSSSSQYPYILKKETKNDSVISTWVMWPTPNYISTMHQNAIVKQLYNLQSNDIFGQKIPKNYFKNKTIVLNLWADYCLPCIEEMPLLNEVKKQFTKDTSIVFVAACRNSANNCKKYGQNFDFTLLANSTAQLLLDKISVSYYPTTLIINKSGIISHYIRQTADAKRYPDTKKDTFFLTLRQIIESIK
jgi:thiol-disulfide isomerase/thioredoxin